MFSERQAEHSNFLNGFNQSTSSQMKSLEFGDKLMDVSIEDEYMYNLNFLLTNNILRKSSITSSPLKKLHSKDLFHAPKRETPFPASTDIAPKKSSGFHPENSFPFSNMKNDAHLNFSEEKNRSLQARSNGYSGRFSSMSESHLNDGAFTDSLSNPNAKIFMSEIRKTPDLPKRNFEAPEPVASSCISFSNLPRNDLAKKTLQKNRSESYGAPKISRLTIQEYDQPKEKPNPIKRADSDETNLPEGITKHTVGALISTFDTEMMDTNQNPIVNKGKVSNCFLFFILY